MNNKLWRMGISVCLIVSLLSACGKTDTEQGTEADQKENQKTDDSTANVSDYFDLNQGSEWPFPVVDDTQEEVDILECVQLGQYKGLSVENIDLEVTAEEVDAYIDNLLKNTQITNGTAQEGDIVYLSYQADVDGRQVSSASSTGTQVVLGENSLPEKLEQEIYGMQPDETKNVLIEYDKSDTELPEIAGKAVKYQITLYTITRSYDSLTEEWLHENTSYDSIKAFKDGIKGGLEQEKQLNEENIKNEEIWDQVMENCEVVTYKKTIVDKAAEQYDTNINNDLAISGLTFEAYLQQLGQTDLEYNNQRKQDIQDLAKRNMIIEAIAAKEGLSSEDEEYQNYVEQMAEEYQVNTEALYSLYGEGELENQITERRVMNLIMGGVTN